jgi:hypothetical protein
MDARQFELVVLALTSALLCGVAIAANHAMATGAFAGLTAAIGVLPWCSGDRSDDVRL